METAPGRMRRHQRTHELVLDGLLKLVRTGKVKVGDPFPSERTLARGLAVSNVVVREAFRILEHAAMVETRQGGRRFLVRGTPVINPILLDAERVLQRDLIELRYLLEVPVTALAAARRTTADLEAISNLPYPGESDESVLAYDRMFHLLIAKATANATLVQIQEHINALRESRFVFKVPAGARSDIARTDHPRIVQAIVDQDRESAAKAMQQHILNSQQLYQEWDATQTGALEGGLETESGSSRGQVSS